jgi:hypothetical protein
MSTPFTPAHRPLAPSAPAVTGTHGHRPEAAAPASGKTAPPLPVVEQVGLQEEQVSLSARALEARGSRGVTTLQSAERLLNQVARQLFGPAGDAAHLSLDSLHLETSSSLSASVSQTSADGWTSELAHLSLDQSAHFIGTGRLTTEDGRSFDFELEVNYQVELTADVASTQVQENGEVPSGAPDEVRLPDAIRLTGKALPPVKFPGGLDDLFKLLGRELSAETHAEPSKNGQLTLRLLRLVDRAALLAPRVTEDAPAGSAERARAAALSYASAAAYSSLGG